MSYRKSAADPDPQLGAFEMRLLNEFQRNLPLTPAPYADMARRLGVSEDAVISALTALQAAGTVSRVGPVFRPNSIGFSTLAAMAVPPECLTEAADVISGYTEVNHSYEREHDYNLWFVLTAGTEERLREVLADMEYRTGRKILNLPLLEDYHIDLGFDLKWN